MSDLDNMAESTWRRFVRWLLARSGYVIEQELGQDEAWSLAVYRRDAGAMHPLSPRLEGAGSTATVVTYRPEGSHRWAPPDLLSAAEQRRRGVAGGTTVLITSASVSAVAHRRHSARMIVLDRRALADALTSLHTAHERARAEHEAAISERAESASRVRTALIACLTDAPETVTNRHGQPGNSGQTPAGTDGLERVLAPVRQALSAIETLIEEWESAVGLVATSDGCLALTGEAAAFDALLARAQHLGAALRTATADLTASARPGDRAAAWWDAVHEELVLHTQALAGRCAALDPVRWRSFSQAYDATAAAGAAELQAAHGRAALRAHRLLDELYARTPAPRRTR